MRYLLDTNIVSELVRHPNGRVAQRIVLLGDEAVGTSIIVAAELRFGAAKKGSPGLARNVDLVLSTFVILPLQSPFDEIYGEMRARLEAKGTVISEHDLLIGVHALSLGLILVTRNTREFARIPGLVVEDWLD